MSQFRIFENGRGLLFIRCDKGELSDVRGRLLRLPGLTKGNFSASGLLFPKKNKSSLTGRAGWIILISRTFVFYYMERRRFTGCRTGIGRTEQRAPAVPPAGGRSRIIRTSPCPRGTALSCAAGRRHLMQTGLPAAATTALPGAAIPGRPMVSAGVPPTDPPGGICPAPAFFPMQIRTCWQSFSVRQTGRGRRRPRPRLS